MKLLKFLLQHSRGGMILAVLAGALSGLASTALLAVINAVLNEDVAWGLGRDGLLTAFIALLVLVPLARVASSFLLVRLGQNAVHDIRLNLTRRILRTPLRDLEEVGPHRLLVVLTDDLNTATDALVTLPVLVMNLFVMVGCLAYMAFLSWPLVLAMAGFLVLAVVSYQLPLFYALRRLRVAREEEDSLFQHFTALTRGNKEELKLHGRRQEEFVGQVAGTSGTMRRLNVFAETVLAVTASWGQVLVFVVVGMILFFGAELFEVQQATLVGYTLVILYMMTPTQVVMNSVPALGRASVAVNKVERLGLSLGREREEPAPCLEAGPAAWKTLELRGVEFSFGDAEHDFHLGPFDLTFHAGETVFLVGGNGSGKTTLLMILLGLYLPDDGEILVDGEVVDPATDRYRETFSAVFADFYLFESLLGLGDLSSLDERARKHLRRLELEGKVKVEKGALSTLDLSQGQRKRLALLTAYLEDRPVYIFDEWAADQDPYFTEVFYRELLPELQARGKTIIAASHDDRYFPVADRLVKMEFGRVHLDQHLAGLEGEERDRVLASAALGVLQ